MNDQTYRPVAASAAGALFLAIALALPAPRAEAEDAKGISASACQPFLPTTYETALFVDNAIRNPTNVNQRVICPINKDFFGTWTAGNVDLQFYIRAGATPGKVACTLYGGGPAFGATQVAYTGTSAVLAAGTNGFMSIANIADPGNGPSIEGWNVLCTLNAGMSLGGFFFNENFDTDDVD